MPGRIVNVVERNPHLQRDQAVAELVPPPQFARAYFDTYRPDPDYPSQQEALERLQEFAGVWRAKRPGGFFSRNRKPKAELPGIYLDGGFGVGKTHVLAGLWHVAPPPKYFGTFIEYTALVGALGYAATAQLLSNATLICIDEFELDDPGDTMLMTRLLGELMSGETRVAATSNTPPGALGEGRFAAADFLREIHGLAARFQTVRIDGLDYRRRDTTGSAITVSADELERKVAVLVDRGTVVARNEFDELIAHLTTVHPANYTSLLSDVGVLALSGVRTLCDQNDALRFVAFVDRAYDLEVPVLASGVPFERVFDDDMLTGGYRKKYLRAISRLVALTSGQLPPHD